MPDRIYLGLNATRNTREIFRAASVPTFATHPDYNAVIGPFRTKRGALFMARYGRSNPHCQCVADAERLAKTNS